jgi:hypothetical protein
MIATRISTGRLKATEVVSNTGYPSTAPWPLYAVLGTFLLGVIYRVATSFS